MKGGCLESCWVDTSEGVKAASSIKYSERGKKGGRGFSQRADRRDVVRITLKNKCDNENDNDNIKWKSSDRGREKREKGKREQKIMKM